MSALPDSSAKTLERSVSDHSEEKAATGQIETADTTNLPQDPDAHLSEAERAAIVRNHALAFS